MKELKSLYYICSSQNIELLHFTENGIQLLYRPSNIQCDWPERVECESRVICDKNDENCQVQQKFENPDSPCQNKKLPNGESCPDSGLKVRWFFSWLKGSFTWNRIFQKG